MKIEEKLKELILSKYKSVRAFAMANDIPYSTVNNLFERGIGNIGISTAIKICDILRLDVDYLAKGELYKKEPSFEEHLSSVEHSHIEKYLTLDEHGKSLVGAVLDIEHARCTTPQETTLITEQFPVRTVRDITPFQLSEYRASAGRGTYLGPEAFTAIMVESNNLTKRALFGVPVSGDSMEPTYNDGDILIVERADSLDIGEIGIFTLDGEGYVKKCGNGELISLNGKYEPIPMNESIVLNGKVIGILDREWIVE